MSYCLIACFVKKTLTCSRNNTEIKFHNKLWTKFYNCTEFNKLTGLLILRDGAISHNQPQITSDRTIHKKSHNSQKNSNYTRNEP